MMDNVSLMFFLTGFNETKNNQFTVFFLTLLYYCLIWLANLSLIVTIISDKSLHEPMYILLCSLCVSGLYGTAGFYPKFLWDLLSPVHVISYSGCLVQILVLQSFVCTDLSIMALMAYDRYVAICRPLQYHSVMSKQRILMLVCFSWLISLCVNIINVILTSRLKLCSLYIARQFCLNWAILKLACFPTDTVVNYIFSYILMIIYIFQVILICLSFAYLINVCVKSSEGRAKFMQTCMPQIISLIFHVYSKLSDMMYMRYGSKNLPQTFQNFIAIEFLVIPPMANPLIYGFKLTKIRYRVLGLVNIKRT